MARTYDPNNVQVIVGGVPLSGFTDGTFIEIAFDEPNFIKVVGADGEVTRAKSNNRSATATITLKQSSPSNDILSGFEAADYAGNAGIVPFMVREIGTGRTLIFSDASWCEQSPNVSYSKDVEDRVWTWALAKTDRLISGNS